MLPNPGTESPLHYHATLFTDPDGLRLELTNYRLEPRQRHDHWDKLP